MITQRMQRLVTALGVSAVMGSGLLVINAKAQAPKGKITPWEAIKIANGKVPGRALNANFEFDEGKWVYGVMIVTNDTPKQIKEVEIDPMTGKVGDAETITPEGEAKEVTAELNAALGVKSNAAPAKESDEKGEKQ